MSEEKKDNNNSTEVDVVPQRELKILVTDEDKHGTEIAAMSNFFDGYIQQLSQDISKNAEYEIITEIPAADLGIISEVISYASAAIKGEYSYLPDFDHLPTDIKEKLKAGIYKIGESKQVDGNSRAVIVDENGVRVKDITLKKVQNSMGTLDTVSKISEQLQMRQIFAKLDGISELQEYQLERDRDRDIVTPFLNARRHILLAQESTGEAERIDHLKKAGEILGDAINAVYTEMATTANHLAKLTNWPVFWRQKQLKTYMGFLSSDLQITTKFVGVQMQICDYLGDRNASVQVIQDYRHVMDNFVNKPINNKGLSAAMILQLNYPYEDDNIDFWYKFSNDIRPMIETGGFGDSVSEIYVVTTED